MGGLDRERLRRAGLAESIRPEVLPEPRRHHQLGDVFRRRLVLAVVHERHADDLGVDVALGEDFEMPIGMGKGAARTL